MKDFTYNGLIYAREAEAPGEVDMIAVGITNGFSRKQLDPNSADDLTLEPACFSLVCANCDCDCVCNNRQEAEAAGWTGIEFVPEFCDRNYLGNCPQCTKELAKT